MNILIRWLRGELRNINRKLDDILELLSDEQVIAKQTKRLKRSEDDLQSAVNKQKQP